MKYDSWISFSCLDACPVSHTFLLSGLRRSGKSLPRWQPFLHVVAEDSADVHKYKKGTCHTKSQNWCLGWAGFHYCDSLVCEVEKQLLWIVCTVNITVYLYMTIKNREAGKVPWVCWCVDLVFKIVCQQYEVTGTVISRYMSYRHYICTPCQVLFGWLNRGWDRQIWGRREMQKAFWLGNLKERDCMEDLGVDVG